MDYEPLVEKQLDESLDYVKSLNPVLGVRAAYWLKVPNRSDWLLHIATEAVTPDGRFEFYPDMIRVFMEGHYESFAVDQLILDVHSDKTAQYVMDLRERYKWNKPKKLIGQPMGDQFADAAYILPYPELN